MEKALLTWRLTPIAKDSDLWNCSSHNGEVWVRAGDAREARTLAADRFRVRIPTTHGRSGMESPWYMRELASCDLDQDARFEATQMACVVYPAVADAAIGQARTDTRVPNTSAHVQPAVSDVVASDLREAVVALLLAKRVDVSGRWLDVYVAASGDNEAAYVIIPARKLKRLIAEELSRLIGRTLSDKETSWIVRSEEIQDLLRGPEAQLSLSQVE